MDEYYVFLISLSLLLIDYTDTYFIRDKIISLKLSRFLSKFNNLKTENIIIIYIRTILFHNILFSSIFAFSKDYIDKIFSIIIILTNFLIACF